MEQQLPQPHRSPHYAGAPSQSLPMYGGAAPEGWGRVHSGSWGMPAQHEMHYRQAPQVMHSNAMLHGASAAGPSAPPANAAGSQRLQVSQQQAPIASQQRHATGYDQGPPPMANMLAHELQRLLLATPASSTEMLPASVHSALSASPLTSTPWEGLVHVPVQASLSPLC